MAVGDGAREATWLAEKVANLRIFRDAEGKLNRSVKDLRGEVLAVSNFTLLADARKGRRPSFVAAAGADEAEDRVAGDRVAAFMPNVPEAVISMLAATSLGAVFSSSP